MNDLVIECSKCHQIFEATKNMLLEHRKRDGRIEVYYRCTGCNRKHPVCYINNEIKNIQKLIDKMSSNGDVDALALLVEKKKYLMDKLNNRL